MLEGGMLIGMGIACLFAMIVGGLVGFGMKKNKEATKVTDDIVTMIETRETLKRAINNKLKDANWWTKRKVRKTLLKKGLAVECGK